MLLVRGKMIDDFSGPDCRFLSAKKSENVYVYYKLGGKRTDMWAGSVSKLLLISNPYCLNIVVGVYGHNH